jgi:hypothetical protein
LSAQEFVFMGAYETEEAGQWGSCQAVLGNQTGGRLRFGWAGALNMEN